jgi:hypothetical protein
MLRRDGTLAFPARILLAGAVLAGLVVAGTSDPFTTLFFLSYVLVGGLLAIRRPKNLVSWLLIGIAFAFIGVASRAGVDIPRLKTGTASVTDELWVWAGSWSGSAAFALFAALAAIFPSGRLPAGRWRRPLLLGLAAGFCIVILTMIAPRISATTSGADSIDVPNPIGLIPDFPAMSVAPFAGLVLTIAVFGLAIASMLARYRGAAETTRLQLRWLLAAISFVLVAVSAGLVLSTLFGNQLGGSIWIPAIIAYPTVPIAIGVAILRYRLYEIDRIVNRALVYGVVTAILAGIFAAVTVLTQRTFAALTGQASEAAIVLTTLAVATLYAPVRRRVEVMVDRYFKYDQRLFGAYRDELRRALDVLAPASAAQRLAREALAETGAIGAAVTGTDGSVLATAGDWPAEPSIATLIRADGAPLSAVLLGRRPDGRPHRPQAVAALAEVAEMAAVASTAIPATVHAKASTDVGPVTLADPRFEPSSSMTATAVEPGASHSASGNLARGA